MSLIWYVYVCFSIIYLFNFNWFLDEQLFQYEWDEEGEVLKEAGFGVLKS